MNAESTTVETHALAEVTTPRDTAVMPGFNSNSSWELAQRIGKAFAASTLVPEQYRNNLANCIVALEMANRMGASPLMVMQNLYIVHGNPGWSSKFLIASFNQCGRFSSLRYEWTKDRTGCRAWAIEKETGERIEGPQVTMAMAKDEGWSTKSGSKWKTMPELMLMYRSAAFLIRTYAPEISMGLRTDDEIIDMGPADVVSTPREAKAAEIGALLGTKTAVETNAAPANGLPTFDYLAAFKRIDAATNREVLALMADEYRDLADSPERDALLEAYRARDAALAS
jgi:hypothetical protein